jgi:pimeloyl-ACP methyl ester carboxylesterase
MTKLLSSKILGQGQPLLILHGFFGMGDNWKTLGNRFARLDNNDGYEVHLIDQRNHGRSFHSDEFNYECMVQDLLYYINHYKLSKVNLIGHSMGGKAAMLFAVSYPELVNKLIVVDIAPKFYPTHHDLIIEGLKSIDFKILKTRKEIDQKLSEHISDLGTRQFLLKNVYWETQDQLDFRFNLKSLIENVNEIGLSLPSLTLFNGLSLFLKGANSGYINILEDQALIRIHFPNSVIKTIKNSGHWIHADNPNDFFENTIQFLK